MTNSTRTFRELRLRLAQEIVRNNPHIFELLKDIDSIPEIEELCDTYAIRRLICWIATRRGCNQYLANMSSESPVDAPFAQSEFSLVESFFLSAQIYPFNCPVRLNGQRELERLANDILDASAGCLTGSASAQPSCDSLLPSYELIGALHEHMSQFDLAIAADGSTDILRDTKKQSKRKSKGQFYTPSWTVDYCLEKSLGTLFGNSDEIEKADTLYRGSESTLTNGDDEPAPPAVLDPSCGTGNFLLGVLDYLRRKNAEPLAIARAAAVSLFGFDTDGKAVCLARVSVMLSVFESGASMLESCVRMLDCGAGTNALELFRRISANIKVTDSIYEPVPTKGFDLVITNPPYLSFGARNQDRIPDATLNWIKHQFPISSEYKIRYNAVFQELALKHARAGGKVCLFVPDGFLTGKRYGKLRDGILKQTKIVSLTEFPDDTIGGAVVGRWCAAIYENTARNIAGVKNSRQANRSSDASNYSGANDSSGACVSSNAGDYAVKLETFVGTNQTYELPVSSLVTRDLNRFRLVFNKIDEELLSRCDKLTPLCKVLRGHTGIRARNGQKTILAETRQGTTFRRGIRSGKSVRPFSVTWDGTWIRVEKQLLFAGGFDSGIVESPKILMRQTGDRIVAAYDDSCLYHLNNVHSFSTSRVRSTAQAGSRSFPNDLHLLTALMNSNLWTYLYRLRTREEGRALAQIDIETVEQMPLPDESAAAPEVANALSRLSGCLTKNGIDDSSAAHIKRCIDRLAYEAYQLSASEMAHVESSSQASQVASAANLPELHEAFEIAVGYS